MNIHIQQKNLSKPQSAIVFLLAKFLQSFYRPTEKQQQKVHCSTTVLHRATAPLQNYGKQTRQDAPMQGITCKSTTLKVLLAEAY